MKGKGLKVKVKNIKDRMKKMILRGVIDGHTSPLFDQAINGVIRDDTSKLVLDFTDISYISSAGIGALIAAHAFVREEYPEEAGGIFIVKANESVRDVFSMLEIDDSFGFVETEEDAIQALDSL